MHNSTEPFKLDLSRVVLFLTAAQGEQKPWVQGARLQKELWGWGGGGWRWRQRTNRGWVKHAQYILTWY